MLEARLSIEQIKIIERLPISQASPLFPSHVGMPGTGIMQPVTVANLIRNAGRRCEMADRPNIVRGYNY
jgi:hypothetical protein